MGKDQNLFNCLSILTLNIIFQIRNKSYRKLHFFSSKLVRKLHFGSANANSKVHVGQMGLTSLGQIIVQI